MNWLAQNGWRGLSVGEALAYPPNKTVAITVDDGCETDLISAASILKENGFNATFYVTTGFVGKPGYMSSVQVRQLHTLGFEIGCHSMTHAYLEDVDEPTLHRETFDARKELEDQIGGKVEHFSCPGGRYDRRTPDMARQAGYRSLATSRAHTNSPATDPFLLGRVAILRNMDQVTFERICTAEVLGQMRLRESMRGVAKRILGNQLYDRFRTLLLRQP
jgi:peptidoglycan/xylan/chitin deacetylase (PgdA/CDA1 family)